MYSAPTAEMGSAFQAASLSLIGRWAAFRITLSDLLDQVLAQLVGCRPVKADHDQIGCQAAGRVELESRQPVPALQRAVRGFDVLDARDRQRRDAAPKHTGAGNDVVSS